MTPDGRSRTVLRFAAHEPVRPRGVADEDGFRRGHAGPRPTSGQQDDVLKSEPGSCCDQGVSCERSQHEGEPRDQVSKSCLAPEEGRDFRRQTDQAATHEDPDAVNHLNWYMATGS